MKFSDDFLSVINRTNDNQFGTGYYGHIDDEYATLIFLKINKKLAQVL